MGFNDNIIEMTDQYIMPTYKRLPLAIVSGNGAILKSDDGRELIDLTSGLGVANLGHSHPEIAAAIAEQAKTLVHVSNLFYTRPQAEVAKKLCELSFGEKIFFANSGAEANEGAIKLARKYARMKGRQDKYKIVTAYRGFHGRTLAALAATGQPEKQEWFKPMPKGFAHGIFNNLGSFTELVDDDTCAVMIELIQGEGGVHIAETDFIEGLVKLCQKHDALLIMDEVQTGFGRTGKMFAYEHYGVIPDVMTIAKGLANGLPIGAIVAKGEAAAVFEKGDHATTFGGGPVVCAASSKVLEIFVRDGIAEKARDLGGKARSYLEDIAKSNPLITEVRGIGLMLALELAKERAPDAVIAGIESGIIINATGPTTIRLIPPLTISEDQLLQGLQILKTVMQTIQ